MSIEVLLMADVQNLGKEGSIVKVSDGYARNYLFPRKLAAPVSETTRRRLEKIKKQREAEEKAHIELLRDLAEKIKSVSVTIPAKIQEGTTIYGSVTAVDIVSVLEKHGVNIERKAILLENPIKALGTYDVKVNLGSGVESVVKVWVVEE